MNKNFIIILAVFCIVSCKKNKDIPQDTGQTDSTAITDTTAPAKYKDSTLKIVGIDTILKPGIYDSLFIPFTVLQDTGMAQNVTLTVTGLPTRVKGEFTIDKGTTPFTSTFKLYTYFVAGAYFSTDTANHPDTLTIAATSSNGKIVKHKFELQLDYDKQNVEEVLYVAYKRNPHIITSRLALPNKIFVSNRLTMHFDSSTQKVFFTNVYLGSKNGKDYYSVDDYVNLKNNIMIGNGSPDFGSYDVPTQNIKGYNGTDTVNVTFYGRDLKYYFNNGLNYYALDYSIIDFSTSSIFYRAQGDIKLD